MRALLFSSLFFLVTAHALAQVLPIGLHAHQARHAATPNGPGMETFFDDLTTIDPARWTVLTSAAGSVAQSGSVVSFTDPGAASDAAAMYLQEPLDRSQSFIICASLSITGADQGFYRALSIIDHSGPPALSGTFDLNARTRIEMQAADTWQLIAFSPGHAENYWREATSDWSLAFGVSYARRGLDTYSTTCFESRVDRAQFRWLAYGKTGGGASYTQPQGYKNFMVTSWRDWSGVEAVADTLYMVLGEGETDHAQQQSMDVDWVMVARAGPVIPDEQYLYLNMANDIAPSFPPPYEIGVFYTYDLAHPFYVPIARDPIVLARGSGGAFDEVWVSRPSVIRRLSTYYMTYDGRDAGGDTALGCATAPGPEGPWAKCANNPIIDDDGGAALDTKFAFLQYDEGEASNNWKIWWSSETGGARGVYYAEHTCLDCATWGSSTLKIPLGSPGAPDDNFANMGTLEDGGAEWQLWYACHDGTVWQACVATSPTLEGTYTKGANPMVFASDAAVTTTDANSSGTTLSVASTSGFVPGEWIAVEAGAAEHYGRIASISAGQSLELYHGFDDIDTASPVWRPGANVHPKAFVNYQGNDWHLYATCFQFSQGAAQPEIACLYEGTGTDLTAITWTPSDDAWGLVPVLYFDDGGPTNYHFQENVALIRSTINE